MYVDTSQPNHTLGVFKRLKAHEPVSLTNELLNKFTTSEITIETFSVRQSNET